MKIIDKDGIKLYNEDFLKINVIKEKSIDLVVTSPPYDVGIEYKNSDDNLIYDDYLTFTENWTNKAYKLSKDDGRMCLNIPLDKNKNGQQ